MNKYEDTYSQNVRVSDCQKILVPLLRFWYINPALPPHPLLQIAWEIIVSGHKNKTFF